MHAPLTIKAASLGLIALGACIMAWNIVAFVRLVRRHKLFGKPSYRAIRHLAATPVALMAFFLVGYVFVFTALGLDSQLLGNLAIGLIFFGGAVYVLLANRFQSKTLDELIAVRDRLNHDALHDPLTGLANRRLLMDRLQRVMLRAERQGTPFSVVFLDLDRFKLINDSMGHAQGDKVLCAVAGRLAEAVRKTDTVARFGGDEFVLLLDQTPPRRAIRVVRRIRESFRRPVVLGRNTIELGASFGLASGPTEAAGPEQMLQNANLALHRAKAMGRDRIKMFRGRMLQRAMDLMTAENDMRRGIEHGEFELYYQPVMRLAPAPELAGFEALLRWNHPKRGLVPPGEFIPLAEDTGLIVELGQCVIEQACETLRNWRAQAGAPDGLHVAVNISPRQFSMPGLGRRVRDTAACRDLPPGSLVVEVTESALMENTALAIQRMRTLREAGYSISIDDFGTGYSSLAHVRDFPVNTIKIDRSFVTAMSGDRTGVEIVRCMVLMAHSLGLAVVAEGVETQEQLALLRQMDCDYVQGFLFSRPVPEPEARALIAAAPASAPAPPRAASVRA